ncbi:MAG TPA: TonB-dependent receptor [Lutibacter sp.]|nr:TonB-dependent receptor [Lutibacter sp.]
MKKLLFIVALLFTSSLLFAQTTLSGKVTDAQTGDALPGASVIIVGKSLGTTSDFDGNFNLVVSVNPPFTLEASSIGFESMSVEVTKNNQKINFKLAEAAEALDEVVVSASRTPERIRESPVTIERMDARAIQATSSPSFYDGLENLKGVDINTNSLTFKSVNTRGFATFTNARFVQLVDGVDNTSPALNFVLGNLIGMNELDVNTVEILPGASSALYGANAFNGILFMTSKDPFKHTGISTYYKTGLTMQEAAGDNRFNDVGIRAAYKFSDKFAAKANFSFMRGTDYWAVDYDQYDSSATAVGDPAVITAYEDRGYAHEGINIYGDEVATDIHNVALAMEAGGLIPAGASGLIPSERVGRTGYRERDLTDYDAKSVKANFALHFKPWENDKEFILDYRVGRGNTIYQGGSRYYLKDFTMDQVKLEFRGKNFFVRGYVTSEDAGDSYDMRFAGINMNKADASTWFGTYVGAYLQGTSDIITQVMTGGGSYAQGVAAAQDAAPQLHAGARGYADGTVTLQPGTPEFDAAFDKVINDPNLLTGAKFVDESSVTHVDANYNLGELISDWADLQIGGSYRKYSLNSAGTIFTDYDGTIDYDEYGAYMQLSKKFADDRLKFTGSARYDKAQNFDGNVSPRLALVYSAGENKNHNFRGSFQTGFRNPTTQDQYIGLDLGAAILVGSAPDNLDRYLSNPIAISGTSQTLVNTFGAGGLGAEVQLSGRRAYDNSFSLSSVLAGAPVKANVDYVQPEKITAYELGYRGKVGAINIDLNGYFNQYDGFISTTTVLVPRFGFVDTITDPASNPTDITDLTAIGGGPTPNALIALSNGDYTPFQVYTNSVADISSYGATLGLSTKIDKFNVGLNYTYAKFDFDQTTDPDYEAGFNTPEHKVKASFGSRNLFENFGFNINYRYSTEYLWQQTFADAMIDARSVIDAQINYSVPSIKSTFKVGGANIGGKEYRSAPGTGYVGSQYFISWTINP